MYPDFAYSGHMQFILAVVVFFIDFFCMHLIADLISIVFNVEVTKRQKALYAFFTGTLLQSAWVYGLFLLGGMESFEPLQYQLLINTNPFAALLYCYLAIKIFKLPPARSIKMMSYVYLFWHIARKLNSTIADLFFAQTEARYNFLLNMMQQVSMLLTFIIVCRLVAYIVRRKRFILNFADNRFFNQKKELLIYFLKALFIYLLGVVLKTLMPTQLLSSAISFMILTLFFIVLMLMDINSYKSQIIENSNLHISALFSGTEEFRGIKHDFYNILQTYSGYLELGDIDLLKKYHATLIEETTHAGSSIELGRKMHENPALVSLLLSKEEYAKKFDVRFQLSLECNLENTYIDNMDLCRVLSCLTDNAIEAAAGTEQKITHFSAKAKKTGDKLFIITNSTDGPLDIEEASIHGKTGKAGHSGIGLTTVRKIVEKYGNCVFQMNASEQEVSAYLEIRARP